MSLWSVIDGFLIEIRAHFSSGITVRRHLSCVQVLRTKGPKRMCFYKLYRHQTVVLVVVVLEAAAAAVAVVVFVVAVVCRRSLLVRLSGNYLARISVLVGWMAGCRFNKQIHYPSTQPVVQSQIQCIISLPAIVFVSVRFVRVIVRVLCGANYREILKCSREMENGEQNTGKYRPIQMFAYECILVDNVERSVYGRLPVQVNWNVRAFTMAACTSWNNTKTELHSKTFPSAATRSAMLVDNTNHSTSVHTAHSHLLKLLFNQ